MSLCASLLLPASFETSISFLFSPSFRLCLSHFPKFFSLRMDFSASYSQFLDDSSLYSTEQQNVSTDSHRFENVDSQVVPEMDMSDAQNLDAFLNTHPMTDNSTLSIKKVTIPMNVIFSKAKIFLSQQLQPNLQREWRPPVLFSWLQELSQQLFILSESVMFGRLASMSEDEKLTILTCIRYLSELLNKVETTEYQFKNLGLELFVIRLAKSFEKTDDEDGQSECSKFQVLLEIVKKFQNVEIRRLLLKNLLLLVHVSLKEVKKQRKIKNGKMGMLKPALIDTLKRYLSTIEFILRSTNRKNNKCQPWIEKTELKFLKCTEAFVFTTLSYLHVTSTLTNIRRLAESLYKKTD